MDLAHHSKKKGCGHGKLTASLPGLVDWRCSRICFVAFLVNTWKCRSLMFSFAWRFCVFRSAQESNFFSTSRIFCTRLQVDVFPIQALR